MDSAVTQSVGLVGRSGELAALRDMFDRGMSTPGPLLAVVLGDPGMGKTRLLAEATRYGAGRPVFRLAGFEPEQRVPLGAAAGLFRELAGLGDEGRRLDALLRVSEPEPDGLEPVRVFESVYRVLSRIGYALIVIDDVQWLDDLSRALIHYLLRAAQADAQSLSMLCATRPAAESTALVRSIQRLFAETSGFLELSVEPLDRDDGVRLARLLRPELSAESAEQVWTSAGGSPFWIEAAARGSGGPGRPSAAIATIFRELSPDAGSCLAAMVVAGRPAYATELADVLGWGSARLEAGLTELVKRGVASSHAGAFHTAHDLVREAALAAVPAQELIALHRRFGESLPQRADGDLALLMEGLGHADAAGGAKLGLALTIARSPQRRLLGESGLARLAAVVEEPSADTANATALKIELAALAEELGDHEAAFERWSALSETLDGAVDRAQAALRAARHGLYLGRSPEMAVLLDRARTDGRGDAWLQVGAEALEHQRLAWLEHDTAAAKQHSGAIVGTAERLLARAGSVDALTAPARSAYVDAVEAELVDHLMDDDVLGLVALDDKTVEASRGLGERHLNARLGACLGQRFLNQWAPVEAGTRAILREAHQQIYPGIAALAAYELASTVYHLGRIADATALYEDARRLGAHIDTGFDDDDTSLGALGPLIAASASDWQAAIASLREEADRQPNPHPRLYVWQSAATIAARFGGSSWRDAVVEFLDAAEADGLAADCVRCLWEMRIVAAEMHARVGELPRAQDGLAAWDAAHPSPHVRAAYMRARTAAVIAAAVGSADAPDLLRAARADAASASLRLEEVWTLIDLGGVLAASDRAGAVGAWTTAVHLATDLGATSEVALAKRRLRTVGVHSVAGLARPSAAGSPLAGLSPRELDVADLAARGVRNLEIAESLFISPKTVEQHLSHIFTKLGVRNRAELGARYAAALAEASHAANR